MNIDFIVALVRPTKMYRCCFWVEKLIPSCLDQFSNLLTVPWSSFSPCVILWTETKMVKSSAKRENLTGGATSLVTSLINRLNRVTLRTEPCGNPNLEQLTYVNQREPYITLSEENFVWKLEGNLWIQDLIILSRYCTAK